MATITLDLAFIRPDTMAELITTLIEGIDIASSQEEIDMLETAIGALFCALHSNNGLISALSLLRSKF